MSNITSETAVLREGPPERHVASDENGAAPERALVELALAAPALAEPVLARPAPAALLPEKAEAASAPPAVAPPAVEPSAVEPSAVMAALDQLRARLDSHLTDTARVQLSAFDRLYEELRQYKDKFVLQAQHGLLLDVVMLYDSIQQTLRHHARAEHVDKADLIGNLSGLLAEAEEVLARRGVERLGDSPDRYDPKLQKARQTRPTDDPAEDGAVIERVKAGFVLDDKPFRKEEVVVKKYSAPK